jgi:hypothetical protein
MTATAVCTPVVWMVVELDVWDAEGSNWEKGDMTGFECVKQLHIQQAVVHLYSSALQNSYLKHFHLTCRLNCLATNLKSAHLIDDLAVWIDISKCKKYSEGKTYGCTK